MQLIKDFKQKSFLNMVWVSEKARKIWEPVISRCSQMVQELEIDSVEAGHRKCAWRSVHERELPNFSINMAKRNLIVLPIKYTGLFEGFAHSTPQVIPGKPKNVYTIISKTHEDALKFRDYHESGDNNGQGEMLGFPKCCRESFSKNWDAGYFDPMYQTANSIPKEENFITPSHPYSIPILRYIGLRIGFHIPCSFKCKETIKLSEERLSLARLKDPVLVKLLEALLSMPMSWDVLHGVSITKTPIFYFKTASVPCLRKHELFIAGSFIPREAKKGTSYPFTEVK